MEVRQRRRDESTANAVARGLNILAVRDAIQARRYMEYKSVPPDVIERVLQHGGPCRKLTPAQEVSEAILPLARHDRRRR